MLVLKENGGFVFSFDPSIGADRHTTNAASAANAAVMFGKMLQNE